MLRIRDSLGTDFVATKIRLRAALARLVSDTMWVTRPKHHERSGGEEVMKAIWNGNTLAESDDTVIVDGNHYFPQDSIRCEYFFDSDHKTVCGWKGEASYYHLRVSGAENADAAWFYPSPKEAAAEIKDRIAFWKGVEVCE